MSRDERMVSVRRRIRKEKKDRRIESLKKTNLLKRPERLWSLRFQVGMKPWHVDSQMNRADGKVFGIGN